jgi:hypothetical protein
MYESEKGIHHAIGLNDQIIQQSGGRSGGRGGDWKSRESSSAPIIATPR